VISVVMATIGVAAIIRGLGPLVFGIGTKSIPLPFSEKPLMLGSVMIPPIQLAGAVVSVGFVIGFTWLFTKSRAGMAMRAVADSQNVAMAMGINVPRYFAYAWALAGIVSAIGGVFWGTLLGADNQLALIGMKVFPVVILGGLDSIAGAVVGGILVGVLENLTAGYLDQYVGGGMKDLVPYLVMIIVLMFRPYGLFGKKRIERI
jgi:branched-chain amino acid transport system permease protein